ncbi:hypothetical protein CJ030_MR8G027632, partial [Morella rubra]
RRTSCCAQCLQSYEQELAKLPKELEKSSEVKSEASQQQLPQWLQNAKAHEDDAKTVDQTQLNRHLGGTLLLNIDQVPTQPSEKAVSTPASPVRTDLALGQMKVTEPSPDQIHNKGQMKDFLGCMSSEPHNNLHEMQSNKLLNTSDADSFKQLLKCLMEKVW